jgi:hypothetical protein
MSDHRPHDPGTRECATRQWADDKLAQVWQPQPGVAHGPWLDVPVTVLPLPADAADKIAAAKAALRARVFG